MNIDITNYLSTIKHISNGAQMPKNGAPFPKTLENLQTAIAVKPANVEAEGVGVDKQNNKINIEEFFRANKTEPKNDIFMDESSELEDVQDTTEKKLKYSPADMREANQSDAESENKNAVGLLGQRY